MINTGITGNLNVLVKYSWRVNGIFTLTSDCNYGRSVNEVEVINLCWCFIMHRPKHTSIHIYNELIHRSIMIHYGAVVWQHIKLSLVTGPQETWLLFQKCNFPPHLIFYSEHFFWNCHLAEAIYHIWWYVNIGLVNGFAPSFIVDADPCGHMSSLDHNGLTYICWRILFLYTPLVLRSEYYVQPRLVIRRLMPWCAAWPGRKKKSCYWLHRIDHCLAREKNQRQRRFREIVVMAWILWSHRWKNVSKS